MPSGEMEVKVRSAIFGNANFTLALMHCVPLERDAHYGVGPQWNAAEFRSARTGRSDWPKVSLVIDWKDMMYEGYPTQRSRTQVT
jgi:hypothetical protein